LPARGLSIFVNSGGGHTAGCCHHLHQRVLHLFLCCLDPRLLRRAPRSGEGAALRVVLSLTPAHPLVRNRMQKNFERAERIVVASCPYALARAGDVEDVDAILAYEITNQLRSL